MFRRRGAGPGSTRRPDLAGPRRRPAPPAGQTSPSKVGLRRSKSTRTVRRRLRARLRANWVARVVFPFPRDRTGDQDDASLFLVGLAEERRGEPVDRLGQPRPPALVSLGGRAELPDHPGGDLRHRTEDPHAQPLGDLAGRVDPAGLDIPQDQSDGRHAQTDQRAKGDQAETDHPPRFGLRCFGRFTFVADDRHSGGGSQFHNQVFAFGRYW